MGVLRVRVFRHESVKETVEGERRRDERIER